MCKTRMTWSPKESKPNKAQGRGTSEMQDLLKEISILYSFVTSLYIKALYYIIEYLRLRLYLD